MENSNSEEKFKLELDLSDKELEIVKELFKSPKAVLFNIKDEELAVKFLRARNFNIDLALELYEKYEEMRNKEDLLDFNQLDKDILGELLSKKFTFLLENETDSGASICIYTARLHFPAKSSHRQVLKSLMIQLDASFRIPSTQKNGLIFIYDMTGSLYSNFDRYLTIKIINLLKGAYPARLCKVIFLTSPLWLRAAFNFLSIFVKEKLQDSVWILTSYEQLHYHLSKEILPVSLGGCNKDRHIAWLRKAFSSLGYPCDIIRKCQDFQGYNGLRQIKDFPSNETGFASDINVDCLKFFKNSYSILLKSEKSDRISSDIIKSNLDDFSPTTLIRTPDELEVNSFEVSPPVDSVDHKILINNATHSSPTSISSGIGSSVLDNKDSDYEMLSISSWDLNLITSGDEDVIEDEDNEKLDFNNGTRTIENSPNLQCCSAKTPFKMLDKPSFFQKVQLKRRNAVREENKTSEKKPTWSYNRPEPSQSLHNALSDYSEDNDEKDKGVTIDFFIESDKHSFYATLNEFRNDSVYGDIPQFTSYSSPLNATKNRYSDIPCIESSRLKLVRDINWNGVINEEESFILKPTDYIHANWVDGYRQINAYICTQGPLSTTSSDFWHMIMQYRAPIIVMTTRPKEQNRDKCFQYWPEVVKEKKIISGINNLFDSFEITSLRSKEFGPTCPLEGICEDTGSHWYRVTLLHIKNLRTGQEHRVNHFYFHSWPDQGIPNSSEGFLHFIMQIRQTYRLNIAKIGYESEMDQKVPPPPIVVHCSAGIGRTGTFIVTDICSKSLTDCGRFNLFQTMLKVRSQRYKCVQNAYQYLYCRNTIIDYAKHVGYLGSQTVNCEEDEIEDSENYQEPKEESDQKILITTHF